MNKIVSTLVLATSLSISLSSFANKGAAYQEKNEDNLNWFQNWYMGIGVNGNAENTLNLHGSTEVFDHISGFTTLDEVEQTSSSPGFEFYVGRIINKNWSYELGYTLLGDMHFSGEIDESREEKVEVVQWNVHLVGIGKLPIGEYFNVFLKGGGGYIMSTQEFLDTSGVNLRDKVNTMMLTYGWGIGLELERWGIRGEYNVISPANNVQDDFYIADIISATIFYKFD